MSHRSNLRKWRTETQWLRRGTPANAIKMNDFKSVALKHLMHDHLHAALTAKLQTREKIKDTSPEITPWSLEMWADMGRLYNEISSATLFFILKISNLWLQVTKFSITDWGIRLKFPGYVLWSHLAINSTNIFQDYSTDKTNALESIIQGWRLNSKQANEGFCLSELK